SGNINNRFAFFIVEYINNSKVDKIENKHKIQNYVADVNTLYPNVYKTIPIIIAILVEVAATILFTVNVKVATTTVLIIIMTVNILTPSIQKPKIDNGSKASFNLTTT